MKTRLLSNPNQRLAGVAVAGAVLFTLMYFLTAIPRLLYPYDLDFIEGGLELLYDVCPDLF